MPTTRTIDVARILSIKLCYEENTLMSVLVTYFFCSSYSRAWGAEPSPQHELIKERHREGSFSLVSITIARQSAEVIVVFATV
jgi:exosortase/archaeosortase